MDKFERHIKRMKGLRDVYEAGTGQHNILSMLITECEIALHITIDDKRSGGFTHKIMNEGKQFDNSQILIRSSEPAISFYRLLSAVLPSVSTKGVTRIVIAWRGVVIKFPKPMKWSNFLRGLIGNINERDTWRWNSGKYERGYSHLLAPVLWCSWGGWILIMKRARLLTEKEWYESDYSVKEHIQNFRGDDTISNYGLIGKKLVKIDYGELDYYWGEDFKNVAQNGR